MTDYISSASLWSLAGLVVGFVIGFITRGVLMRHDPTEPPPRPRKARRFDLSDTARIVVGFMLLGLVGYFVYAQQTETACQRDANRAFDAAFAERGQASHESTVAQRVFLRVELDPAATPAARAQAGSDYLAALDRLDAAQTAHPLNVPICGGG